MKFLINIPKILILGYFLCFAALTYKLYSHQFTYYTDRWPGFITPDYDKLKGVPAEIFRVIARMEKELPEDAVVYTLYQTMMEKFSSTRYVRYADPRLNKFYESVEPVSAMTVLRELGITHVHTADFPMSAIENSQMSEILADPRYAILLGNYLGQKLYRINYEGTALDTKKKSSINFAFNDWLVDNEPIDKYFIPNGQMNTITIPISVKSTHQIMGPKLVINKSEPPVLLRVSAHFNTLGTMWVELREYTIDTPSETIESVSIFGLDHNLAFQNAIKLVNIVWNKMHHPIRETVSVKTTHVYSGALYGFDENVVFQHLPDINTDEIELVFHVTAHSDITFWRPEITVYLNN